MQAAELFTEGEIGTKDRQKLRANGRHIHRIADHALSEKIDRLLGYGNRHVELRLVGRRAQMRCRDHLIQLEQWMIGWRRLVNVNIERCAGDFSCLYSIGKILLIDNAAALA